jgi:hypothetical protein
MFPAFRFPDLGRFARHHPLPRSTPKNKDLAVSTPGLTSGFPRFPDVPNHQISKARSARHTPTRLFPVAYCKQKTLHESTLGPPLRHAWVALGPRLGHPNPIPVGRGSQRTLPLPLCRPNLTQGHPGRPKVLGGFAKHQGPATKGSPLLPASFVKDRPRHNFFALERISNSTICSPMESRKKGLLSRKNVHRSEKIVHPRGGASL